MDSDARAMSQQDNNSARTELLNLPAEILINIKRECPARTELVFRQTCRLLYSLPQENEFTQHDRKYAHRMGQFDACVRLEAKHPQLLVCAACLSVHNRAGFTDEMAKRDRKIRACNGHIGLLDVPEWGYVEFADLAWHLKKRKCIDGSTFAIHGRKCKRGCRRFATDVRVDPVRCGMRLHRMWEFKAEDVTKFLDGTSQFRPLRFCPHGEFTQADLLGLSVLCGGGPTRHFHWDQFADVQVRSGCPRHGCNVKTSVQRRKSHIPGQWTLSIISTAYLGDFRHPGDDYWRSQVTAPDELVPAPEAVDGFFDELLQRGYRFLQEDTGVRPGPDPVWYELPAQEE